MTVVCRVRHGSHLFGTHTETSDLDTQEVYLPPARSILLGKGVHSQGGLLAPKTAGADDTVSHTLARFITMVLEGQTLAIEILFAPEAMHLVEPHPVFLTLRQERHRLISRNLTAFVGYCQKQAGVYGAKGHRLEAALRARDLLKSEMERLGKQARAQDVLERFGALVVEYPTALGITQSLQANGTMVDCLVLCGRMVHGTAKLEIAVRLSETILSQYGERAKRAQKADGHDFKALSHAVRVGYEAHELLSTGHLTLPHPKADYLRQIKQGLVPAQHVMEEIDDLLALVESAQASSPLPETPDQAFAEDLLLKAYQDVVARAVF